MVIGVCGCVTDTKSDHSSSSALLFTLFGSLLLLLTGEALTVLVACGNIVSNLANSSALIPGSGHAMFDAGFDGVDVGFGCKAICGTRIDELANGGAAVLDAIVVVELM